MVLNKLYIFVLVILGFCVFTNVTQASSGGVVSSSNEKLFPCVSYRMINLEKGGKDDSPLGYWRFLVEYPEIYGEFKKIVKERINKKIADFSIKYRCDERGDYSFSAQVKYLDEKFLSMTYETMWMCPQQASPGSTSGAFLFDLVTGDAALLKSEFIDSEKRDDFYLAASDKINKKLTSGGECPVKDEFDYFYKVKGSLVFVAEMEHHSDSGCVTEIKYSLAKMKKYLKPNSILLRE